jgi:hypothetical protein
MAASLYIQAGCSLARFQQHSISTGFTAQGCG